MPGTSVPFRYITGLPERAQFELERDFLALQQQINFNPTVFDATIDPAAVTNPAHHLYKNLTDLLAHETWSTTFIVGVIERSGLPITEPGGLTAPGNLTLFGVGPGAGTWTWPGINPNHFTVALVNLNLDPSVSTSVGGNAGTILAYDCRFGTNITDLNSGGIVGQAGEAWQCRFAGLITVSGSIGTSITNSFYQCNLAAGIAISSQGTAIVIGGICTGVNYPGSSFSGLRLYADLNGGNVTVGGSGQAYIVNTGLGGSVTVTSNQNVYIQGAFGSGVDMSTAAQYTNEGGSPFGAQHTFIGQVGGPLDFAGPGFVDANVGQPFGSSTCKLRGRNVRATLMRSTYTIPAVDCIGLTHSNILLTLEDVGNGTKAYAFDVNSHNNILIVSGSNVQGVNTITPSTDLGYKNRVITEDSDSLVAVITNIVHNIMGAQSPPEIEQDEGDWFPIPGPQGPKGTTGNAGPTGPQGPAANQSYHVYFEQYDADEPDIFPDMMNQAPPTLPDVPIGTILMWGAAAAPPKYLLCDGTSYSRTTQAQLFNVIGTTFGSADGTHFNVPDFRDRNPRGASTLALGATGGGTTHSHTVGTIAAGAHAHNLTGGAATASIGAHAHSVGSIAAGSHTHGSSAMKADIDMVAIASPNIFEANRTTGSYTRAVQAGYTGTPAASSGTSTRGAAVDGSTDATTPGMSGATANDNANSISGATDNTTPTMSGSTATAAGPIDPTLAVTFIIKAA